MAFRYCSNCGEKVQRKYTNCPTCGIDLDLEDKDLFDDDLNDISEFDDEYTEEDMKKLKEIDSIPDISDDMPLFDNKDLW